MKFVVVAVLAGLLCALPIHAQRKPLDVPDPAEKGSYQRTRLFLKNGTYQVVLSYQVNGNVVEYRSAERNGELEEVPLKLVDLAATVRWFHEHVEGAAPAQTKPPVLSPELAKEEADRAAITPEVAPNLHLPEEVSVLALDTFEATPELVPMPQQGSDLNKESAHAVLKQVLNPASSPHRILEIKRNQADVQLHVADPVFYVRIGDDLNEGGGGFVVDTHGTAASMDRTASTGGAAGSSYILERVDSRQDSRIVESFRIAWVNSGRKQPDIIETRQQDLPGGHWMKLTPTQPLEFGEYALIEIVSDHEVNLNVWDFGVHPTTKENIEALRPEEKRPVTLKSRKP
jgi:hypothetical protein